MQRFSLALAALTIFALVSMAQAAVTITGSVDPSDYTNWISSTTVIVGANYLPGAVTVDSGSSVSTSYVGIGGGHWDGSATGTVTVTGEGSTWTSSSVIDGSYGGNPATINILDRGYISCSAMLVHGPSTLTVSGTGSRLACANNFGTTAGGVSNITDGAAVNSWSGSTGYDHGTTNISRGASWTMSGDLAVNGGSLTIISGGSVSSSACLVSSAGVANIVVSGADSSLVASSEFRLGCTNVGGSAEGTMKIANCASFTSGSSHIGASGGSNIMSVSGTGSKWTCNGDVTLDSDNNNATLSISGGGAVTSVNSTLSKNAWLAIDVGQDSAFTSSGTLLNNGTIRLNAGAKLANGSTYSPITAGTWNTSGTGTVQTLGGTWDADQHEFVVSSVKSGTSGLEVSAYLNVQQRVSVTDGAGWKLGASFAATDDATQLKLTATAIRDGDAFDALGSLISEGDSVLSAWSLSTAAGYAEGDPVYLSLLIGAGYSLADLGLWHYDGSDWSAYAPDDATYDGAYVNFTVTGFSGYAITGVFAVPEPNVAALLLVGLLSLAGYVRRRRRSGCA